MTKLVKSLAGWAVALGVVSCAGTATGQEAFGVPGPAGVPLPAVAVPLSKTHGVGVTGAPVLMLNRLDNAQLIAQADGAAAVGKRRMVGVARPISLDASMGTWSDAPDGGKYWALEVSSPGAVGMRIHLTQINLPEGAELVVHSVADPSEIAGPYTGQGGLDRDDVYTPAAFTDKVRIELYLPPGTPAGPLPFDADNIQHLFRSPLESLVGFNGGVGGGEGGPQITPTVGNCHNDVTCFPTWANVAKAVGIYFFSDGSGSFQCTGQLIATTNADMTPYFITAAHCVNTAAEAATVQVYWLYQTSACNGSVPALGSLQQTNGANLMATLASSDGSLLRLTGSVPGNLFYVGWTSTAVTNGAAVSCVHHPDGSWKRISFATATDQAGCTLGTQAQTVDAAWSSGVTEGGSSGSGLYRNDTQQLIGTLSCGPSFCGATGANLHDGFGRFASFYPTISSFLAGGSDDGLEENDTCAAARQLSPVIGTTLTNSSLTVKSTDEDWYKYTLPAGATVSVTLTFNAASGVANGQLYTTCGGVVLASASGSGNTRTLTYLNSSGSADEVYFRVYLTGGTTNTYDMATLVTQVPTNNACAAATTVTGGNTYAGTTVFATNDGTSSCPTDVNARTRPDVWYTFTSPSNGTLTLDTCLSSPTDTVISVHSACPGTAANQIACNDDALATGPCGGNANNYTSYLTTQLTPGQTVKIRVGMWGPTAAPFTLRVGFTPIAMANDTCDGAITIGSGATPYNTAGALTESTTDSVCNFFSYNGIAKDLWYRYTAECTGDMVVDTCGSSYDTKLAVYGSCPTGNDSALGCDDDADPACSGGALQSRVIVSATANHIYYIRVGGYRSSAGVETSGAGVLNVSCNPVTPPCPADMGAQGGVPGQDGVLDNNDFVVFIDYFFAANPLADVGVQGGVPGSDGTFDNNDFVVFINMFFAGCP